MSVGKRFMSVVNMAKNIKEVHPDTLVCYKVGAFVNCYGKDAYILSFLFNYKIKILDNNNIVSGFPKNALPKLKARLKREKIDNIIIDTKNNYDVNEKEKYNNLNRYDEIMEKAQKNTKLKVRIQKISDYLFKNKDTELIRKIEDLIYESRKI